MTEDFFAEFRAGQDAKRAAIVGKSPAKKTEKAPVCRCGLEMVKRLGIGKYWCPFCQITAADLVRKTRTKVKPDQGIIKAVNDKNPLRRFIRHFTIRILEDYGLKHHVVFGNFRGGQHKTVSDDVHQIRFGYDTVDRFAEQGFQEYKTMRYLWDRDLIGFKALWAFAIHEAAHALQTERNGRWHGGQHTPVWVAAVEELQAKYPFEEVAGEANDRWL